MMSAPTQAFRIHESKASTNESLLQQLILFVQLHAGGVAAPFMDCALRVCNVASDTVNIAVERLASHLASPASAPDVAHKSPDECGFATSLSSA
jgi:hypothetical protein